MVVFLLLNKLHDLRHVRSWACDWYHSEMSYEIYLSLEVIASELDYLLRQYAAITFGTYYSEDEDSYMDSTWYMCSSQIVKMPWYFILKMKKQK